MPTQVSADRRGIFFEVNDIYGSPGDDSYWNVMTRDLAAALRAAGQPCDVVNPGLEKKHPCIDREAPPPFFLTWNFNCGRLAVVDGKTVMYTAAFAVRHVTLLLDHPIYLFDRIQETLKLHQELGREPPYMGVMDVGHIAYLKAIGVPEDHMFQFRQAGPEARLVPPHGLRDLDIVFHGTINAVEKFPDFCMRIGIKDRGTKAALKACVMNILEEPIDVYDAISRHVLERCTGARPSATAVAFLCRQVDRLTRDIRRVALLQSLGEFPIQFVGNVAPEFRANNPEGIYHGSLPFSAVSALLERSKIALADTANFRDCGLMRLFYSIQAGCVPVVEMNPYIRAAFPETTDWNLADSGGNKDRVEEVVQSPVLAQSLSDSARQQCSAGHTWAHRISPLVATLVKGQP